MVSTYQIQREKKTHLLSPALLLQYQVPTKDGSSTRTFRNFLLKRVQEEFKTILKMVANTEVGGS